MEVEAIHENEKLEPNKGNGIRQAGVLEMSSEGPSSQDPPNEILAQKGDIIPSSQDVLNEIMGQKRDIVMKDASNSRRKLLVLDINGLLADIVEPIPRGNETFLRVGRKAVFKRPHCEDFMLFCLERFDVGIWSSRTKKNVDSILARLLGYDIRFQLKFCWGQSNCNVTNFKTRESGNKFLMYKEIKKLSAIGGYDESNTLLVDDTPYKAYKNPPNTTIFPNTYNYKNLEDDSLGPEGDLRVYLEGLALAKNVQEYVKNHPFGQRPIISQHIVVPKPIRYDVVWRNCALIFVRKTNQLKLLEFYDDKRGRVEAYMQTIGSRTWRSIDKVPCQYYGRVLPVLLNGQYHWLDCKEMIINSLDAEKEVFRVIHTPPSFKNCVESNLGLLDGCLCLSLTKREYCERSTEVWVMNIYGITDSWIKIFVITIPQLGLLTCLKNGEFLMLAQSCVYGVPVEKTNSAMICYNPHSRHSRYITSHNIDETLRRLRMFS
ncbi:hypothetical protein POM88_052776 [Heracleum sosnowskyi]|uniref:Mitochondrial import inner membrane translocase subunit TIM50 n=1 Tax=Heracleum sosnowskyi TaxID=360622 RepID=A0AAD8LYD3_9APIA|nr:hypothetical protein POM88_052776 [Heracleum sosnowskyi]